MPTEHYFSRSPQSEGGERTIEVTLRGHAFRFVTGAGVFSREHVDRGTRLLIKHLAVGLTDQVLDLGCGWGAVGVVAARLAPEGRITLVDVNQRAVDLARRNLALNAVANAEVLQGDGFAPLPGRRFDVIALNPPIRAGLARVHELIEGARLHLAPGGRFYLVARTQQGALRLAEKVAEVFETVEVVAKGGGYRLFATGIPSSEKG